MTIDRCRYGFFASSFDPFPHPGHLWAMEQAVLSGQCDYIIAAIHADPTRERPWKHPTVCTVEERRQMLSAIRMVDTVLIYASEPELLLLLKTTDHDVRILGDDYIGKPDFTGSELGKPVFYAKRKPDWSSTNFMDRIARAVARDCACKS